jgi:hypothetical protein
MFFICRLISGGALHVGEQNIICFYHSICATIIFSATPYLNISIDDGTDTLCFSIESIVLQRNTFYFFTY